MKCPLCHQQKGKRGCKLNSNQLICPACCGQRRTAQCTGCGYYQASSMSGPEKRTFSKKFIAETNPELDDRCDEALALADEGKLSRAKRILEQLRQQHPNYHTVLYGLGVCHAMQMHVDDSISYFKRAVEIFPIFPHAYFNLGSAYCQKAQLQEAVQAYETAIEQDGANGSVGRLARERLDELEAMVRKQGMSLSAYLENQRTFDRAFEALAERRYQTAIDLFNQVLEVERNHVQSYSNMGLAYAGLGNRQKALECLDKAIELDPDYEPAIVNRASIKRMRDDEALPDVGDGAINYYRDFKVKKKSYIRHLLDRFRSGEECR